MKPKRTPDSLPGINLRELLEEHNWPALAGLALLALGLLIGLQALIDLDFNLWALLLVGGGGWLAADAWQKYQAAGQRWTDSTRSRLIVGAGMVLIGLLGVFEIDWWGLLLLSVGIWLGVDAWQQYQAAGRTWTHRTRRRMIFGVLLGLLGLSGLVDLGSAWLLLIIVGAAVIFWRARSPYRE